MNDTRTRNDETYVVSDMYSHLFHREASRVVLSLFERAKQTGPVDDSDLVVAQKKKNKLEQLFIKLGKIYKE